MCKDKLHKLIEQIEKNKNTDRTGEERIARVLEGEDVDYLPLIFWKPRNASIPGKTYNMKEQFYDKYKMLYAHLEEIAECSDSAFDAPLCLRPNFGTILIPSMFGLEYNVYEDSYPWITKHLSKEEILKFDIRDISRNEMMLRVKEYMQFFRENLPQWIHVYLSDTQGPFDIAHMVYGDDIFYALYDDPEFVHSLMEVCTEMYIEVSHQLKKVINEPCDQCYHGHALPRGIYLRKGGVRVSEDTATLLSPSQIDEFVIPYVKKAVKPFGGGFIHFCGKNEYLLDSFLKMDGIKAINLGNPEMHDFKSTMKKFLDHKKCYFGVWPKEEDETLDGYIHRMINASDHGTRGLLLHFDENMFKSSSCEEILNKWKVQCKKGDAYENNHYQQL